MIGKWSNSKNDLTTKKINATPQGIHEGPSTKSLSQPRGKGMAHHPYSANAGKLLDHQTHKYVPKYADMAVPLIARVDTPTSSIKKDTNKINEINHDLNSSIF